MKKYIINAIIPIVVFCMTTYLWYDYGVTINKALDAGTTFGLLASGLSIFNILVKVTDK